MNDYECYNKIFYEFDSTECASKSCPLECQFVDYDLSVSSFIEPSLTRYSAFFSPSPDFGYFCSWYYWLCSSGQVDYETFKNYFVSFYVYYPSLTYTRLETLPAVSMSDLLSNLGGSMGLIVSLSVFTLAELTELFVLILHALLFKKTNKILASK